MLDGSVIKPNQPLIHLVLQSHLRSQCWISCFLILSSSFTWAFNSERWVDITSVPGLVSDDQIVPEPVQSRGLSFDWVSLPPSFVGVEVHYVTALPTRRDEMDRVGRILDTLHWHKQTAFHLVQNRERRRTVGPWRVKHYHSPTIFSSFCSLRVYDFQNIHIINHVLMSNAPWVN